MSTLLPTIKRIISLIDCREASVSDGACPPPALPPIEFEYLSSLVQAATEQEPYDALLWFWRGWAYQILATNEDWQHRHPYFEAVETAYLRALEIDEAHAPAAMMLSILYFDDARRNAAERAALEHGFASWEETLEAAGPWIDRLAALDRLLNPRELSVEERAAAERRELAHQIVWGTEYQPSAKDMAEVYELQKVWWADTGAGIVERVYNPVWIYEGEPVTAFHTDYIGWLWIVEDIVCFLAPEGQASRFLYELTDAWQEDSNHPIRGEFYDRAAAGRIDDPVAHFDCVTKAVLYLAASGNSYDDWLPQHIMAGVNWMLEPSHRALPEYDDLVLAFAEALGVATSSIGTAETMTAVVQAISSKREADEAQTGGEPTDEADDLLAYAKRILAAVEKGQADANAQRAADEARQQRTDETLGGLRQDVKQLGNRLSEFLDTFEGANDREAEAERFAKAVARHSQWVEQMVRHFDGELKNAPADFRRDLIAAEAVYDYCRSTNYENFALVVILWGRLVEVWLREGLLVPYGRWLDGQTKYSEAPRYGLNKALRKYGSWEATLGNKVPEKPPGADQFLVAAAVGQSAALREYLNSLHGTIKVEKWEDRRSFLAKLEELRNARNRAAHERGQVPQAEAEKFHHLLWEDGLVRDLCKLATAAAHRKV